MRRLTPNERRDVIIEATLEVARKKGLGAATVRDIAEAMGTSSGLIHHYFDSMDQVLAGAFSAAATHELERVRRAVDRSQGPVDGLARFVAAYTPAQSDWSFQLWLDAWSEASRRPELQQTSRHLNLAWQEMVAEIVRAGVDRGVMESEDPNASAWRIISLLDGLMLQVVAHPASLTRESALAWAGSAIEAELGLPAGSVDREGKRRPPPV